MTTNEQPVVLSGASTGIGKATALRLDNNRPLGRTLRRAIGTGLLASACSAASGCATGEPPECGEPPAERITGFVVTTVTGDNATDLDIDFCFQRKSDDDYECTDMDNEGDTFQEWQTDVFEISIAPIKRGDLERFKIVNTGGGWFESSWDMHSLKVEAQLESGATVLLYDAPHADENIEIGHSYDSSECDY